MNEQYADTIDALEVDEVAVDAELGDGAKTKGSDWIDPSTDP